LLHLYQNKHGAVVYPDPTTGHFTVDWNATITELTVRDLAGKVICVEHPGEKTIAVDISALNNGVYIVSLSNGNVTVYQKIMLNK
jgi:hypothetical protein